MPVLRWLFTTVVAPFATAWRRAFSWTACRFRPTFLLTLSQGYNFRLDLETDLNLAPGTHTLDIRLRGLGTGNPYVYVLSDPQNSDTLSLLRFQPGSTSTLSNAGQTVVTPTQTLAGLTVHREITVPNSGGQDFARTVDFFQNPTSSPITTTVHLVGNLGSDAATTVFATSTNPGGGTPTINDQWIGTDDADGTGTPAIIHYIHGPSGLVPAAVNVIDDNIDWTYNITVPANSTLELGTYTILATTRAAAIAAANNLVTASGFGGQAALGLSPTELANFQFTGPLTYTASTGTPTTYTLRLDSTGTILQLVDNSNNLLASQPLATTTSVSITGHAGGTDTLNLDFTNGYFSIPGGITFNGGGNTPGVNGGTLNIIGGSFSSITDTLTVPGAGNFLLHPTTGADLTVNYLGLLPVLVNQNVPSTTDLVFNLPAGDTDATLTAGPAGMETLSSASSAFETTTFSDPANSLTINATPGAADALTINALNSSFTASLIVNLSGNTSGTSTINLTAPLQVSSATAGSNVAFTAQQINLGASISTVNGVNSGTVTMNGPVVLTTPATTLSAGSSAVNFNATLDSDATTARTLIVNSTGTTSFADNIGSGHALATLTVTGGTTAFTSTASSQSLNAATLGLNNLSHAAAATLNLGGSLTVGGNLTNSGTGSLVANGNSIAVAGNWSVANNGFSPGSGTVTFNGTTGTQTLTNGTASFNNLSHTGASLLQLATKWVDSYRHRHQLRRHLRHQYPQRQRRHPLVAGRQHHRHHRHPDQYQHYRRPEWYGQRHPGGQQRVDQEYRWHRDPERHQHLHRQHDHYAGTLQIGSGGGTGSLAAKYAPSVWPAVRRSHTTATIAPRNSPSATTSAAVEHGRSPVPGAPRLVGTRYRATIPATAATWPSLMPGDRDRRQSTR